MLRKHKIKWKVIPSILKDHLLLEVILSRNMWINLPTIQLSMEVDFYLFFCIIVQTLS